MANGCTGRNEGLSEWFENWDNGQRQPAYHAYPLEAIQAIARSPVSRLIFAESSGGLLKVMGVVGQKAKQSKHIVRSCCVMELFGRLLS